MESTFLRYVDVMYWSLWLLWRELFSMKHSNTFNTYKISPSFKQWMTDVLSGFVKPFITGDSSGQLLLSVISEPTCTWTVDFDFSCWSWGYVLLWKLLHAQGMTIFFQPQNNSRGVFDDAWFHFIIMIRYKAKIQGCSSSSTSVCSHIPHLKELSCLSVSKDS